MDGSPPTAKRKPVVQARALATREKILAQAEHAFARCGFDAASLTSDILAPAGVSVGSFHHQFDDKADVLFAMLRERVSSRRARIAELLATTDLPFVDRVQLAVDALLDDMETSPDAWQVQFRERQHPNPATRGAVEVGWVGWENVGRSLVERCFDTTPERAGTAAHLTVLVGAGLLRDYLDADDEVRRTIRAEVRPAAEFCDAGAARITGG